MTQVLYNPSPSILSRSGTAHVGPWQRYPKDAKAKV